LTLPPVQTESPAAEEAPAQTAAENAPAPAPLTPAFEVPASQGPDVDSLPESPAPETLAQLEQEVDSPHVSMVDDARQAVATAGLDIPPPPRATESLGAQHVDLDLLAAASAPEPPMPVDQSVVPPAPVTSTMTGIADILKSTSSTDQATVPLPSTSPVPEAVPDMLAGTDSMAPPPVPPPMTAPYFEPKTSHHNPYLNPDNKPTTDEEDKETPL